ncbi:hypothetical protein CHUAL_005914 [Chamberlinius hualienensis]
MTSMRSITGSGGGAALTAVTCMSSILGLICNIYILLVLVSNRQMRTTNNLLLLNLTVVNILSSLQLFSILIPTPDMPSPPSTSTITSSTDSINIDIKLQHYNESTSCILHGFIWTALLPVTIWTLCGLNCDRYAAIASPLHYSRFIRSRRIVVFITLVWTLGISLAIPPLLSINRYALQPDLSICTADFSMPSDTVTLKRWYPLIYTVITILIPSILIVVCNVRILIIASYHRHRIVSAIYEVTLRAQATITHQRNPFYLSKYKGRNAVVTIFQLVGSLLLLYSLQGGVMLWETVTGKRHSLACLNGVAFGLVSCSPTINGIVYGVKSRVLRTTFKNLLRKHLTTSEVRHEIKRRSSVVNGGGNFRSSIILRLQGNNSNNSSIKYKQPSTKQYPLNHSFLTTVSNGHLDSN